MRRIAIALVLTIAFTNAAEARDAYDCSDHVGIPAAARWSPPNDQTMQTLHDFYAKFQTPQLKFNVRMCGVSEEAKQVILVDAVHIGDSSELCGDALNFAVLYDPGTRQFREPVPREKLCPAAPKAP